MKRILCLLVLALLMVSGCKKDAPIESQKNYGFQFQFITENYKPFNYQEGSELKGLAPDILRQICSDLNIPFEVTVLPWDEGYKSTLKNNNAVLFSTVLNSQRRDLFKWAGPIASLNWEFYAPSPAEVKLSSLDDAKAVKKIGVIKDYAIEQYLTGQGFTNLSYVNDNIEGFDKLLNGEIDLFPADRITAEAALKSMGRTIWSVTPLMTILTDLVYFAFNKEIPDYVVNDFQNGINKLRSDGTLQRLYQKYMPLQNPPAELQIYTEQYPPLTFRNSFGEITGFGTDLVNEIMKLNETFYPVTLSLWSNAYSMIQNNPNFCLFTMDRTPQRENLFQWVGPLGTNRTFFFIKAGSGINIGSVDEAKALASVGTVNSWFSDQYLRQLGFTNLISDPDPQVMVGKLMRGEVKAFVCSEVTFPDIVESAGYDYSQVTTALELMSSDYYIAFSTTTSSALVGQWQNALNAIRKDGTYYAIYSKWFKK